VVIWDSAGAFSERVVGVWQCKGKREVFGSFVRGDRELGVDGEPEGGVSGVIGQVTYREWRLDVR